MLRILFINRMASMERGGGETFDLEIARHLARMGHQVTFLSGIPVFGRARLPIGRAWGGKGVSGYGGGEDGSSPTPIRPHSHTPIRTHTLRAPMFPWFPWDRVKGGWRVRVAEFWLFEKLAARWVWKHRHEFDVIQVCELPTLVATVKQLSVKGYGLRGGEGAQPLRANYEKHKRHEKREKGGYESDSLEMVNTDSPLPSQRETQNPEPRTPNFPPIILRLTAPNAYDPYGGIQQADAVIASGTSIEKIRKSIRPDCYDVPNAVDVERFGGKREEESGRREEGGERSDVRSQKSESSPSDLGPLTSDLCPPTSALRLATSGFRPPVSGLQSPVAALRLLYVARFQAFKNHRLLIDGYARFLKLYPNARLVLVGSGPLEGKVKKQCRELGITEHVQFMGEVPFDQLPAIYAEADVMAISSEYESFCFAAIEAMASGLPIVTTDCGWVPGLIGDTLPPIQKQWIDHTGEPPGRFVNERAGERTREVPGGIVVDREDAKSMVTALTQMVEDESLRRRCGEWNREKAVREHGWDASAERLLGVYEKLIRERRK